MIREKMREQGMSVVALAKKLHLHRNAVHRKINGSRKWTYDEILTVSKLLGIPRKELVASLPQTKKVQINEDNGE